MIAIVIPARYGSSRFPGKPLAMIDGVSMLERVYRVAKEGSRSFDNVKIIVATEDKRIKAHAESFDAHAMITSENCRTGSDRCLDACHQLDELPDVVINLQGDAPLTPPNFIKRIIETLLTHQHIDVATPVTRLSWPELDTLREQKKQTPFSGTTAVLDKQQKAIWFSKQILPAIRNEETYRREDKHSPVLRHIGLYGFRYNALKQFINFESSYYETFEGLEQLRMLENGLHVQAVVVDYGALPAMSGIDTPTDLERAEALLKNHKDFYETNA